MSTSARGCGRRRLIRGGDVDHADKQRIVLEAAALMGHAEVAGRLGVSVDDVSSWSSGSEKVPDLYVIALREILVSWSGKHRFK